MIVFLPTNFAFDRSFLCDQIDDLLARVDEIAIGEKKKKLSIQETTTSCGTDANRNQGNPSTTQICSDQKTKSHICPRINSPSSRSTIVAHHPVEAERTPETLILKRRSCRYRTIAQSTTCNPPTRPPIPQRRNPPTLVLFPILREDCPVFPEAEDVGGEDEG